ncbi:MAG: 2-keto-4-pentenoate hydratase [Pseudomonadota bacterium]
MEANKSSLYEEIAAALKKAEKTRIAASPVSKAYASLEIKDAYRIQLINIDKEIAGGRRITGKKIGLTSLAMQNMLGVNQPDYGHLLDNMEVKNNTIKRNTMLQPKVEGEIAFILKEDVKGPDATAEDVIKATEYVAAAIEIVDSRIADWKINIIDTVADNASSGMYVIADKKVDPKNIDLKALSMQLYKNSERINAGVGADVLGDPAYAVAWLANALWAYGVVLKKGEVVLSGALTAALTAEAGDEFRAVFSELGEVSVKFI